MIGWIKLHRKITEHWIWSKPEYLQWWIDILLQANFESKKILIKSKLLECPRGDVLYSYDTWAKRWKCSKSKAMRFLNLLEKDSMIVLKNETVTTRITICKYDSYQDERNDNETQVKRNRNASETQVKPTKESKEIEELNNNKYTTEQAKDLFEKAGLQGRFFSKMEEVHSLDEKVIKDEFRRWKIFYNEDYFNSESHLKNSFNIWLNNFKPQKQKTTTKKTGSVFDEITENDLK